MISIKTTFLIVLTSLLFCCCSEKKTTKEKKTPNILVILADDMGFGDPASFNTNSRIATPNINNLAESGIKFTNAHAAGPWCVPSRYGLLTGRYPFRNDRKYEESLIAPGQTTIGVFMQQNNYQTACIGKWHQGIIDEKNPKKGERLSGGPVDHGFDYFFGLPASLDIPPYYYIENDLIVGSLNDSIGNNNSEGWSPIQGAFWRKGKIAKGYEHKNILKELSGKVTGYLEDYKKSESEKPFFLYFAMTAPHTPWLPEAEFEGKSQVGMYGDFVMQADHYVGKVLQKLDDLGLSDDTIVLFTSDNGPVWYPNDVSKYGHNSVGLLSGMKSDLLEGGHRMPFIVRWPNTIKPGLENNSPICFTDVLSTFADILDTPLPANAGEDSYSFLPLLTGKNNIQRPPIIHNNGDLYSIIDGHWKYINGKGPGGFSKAVMDEFPEILPRDEYEGQLYDLSEDIGERHNLYAQYPDKVLELSQKLKAYIQNPTGEMN